MSIDMSQFLGTFYEGSFEGLKIMETELLALDTGNADSETYKIGATFDQYPFEQIAKELLKRAQD